MISLRRLLALTALLCVAAGASAQLLQTEEKKEVRGAYDRHEIPGDYTLGFYADERASSSELKLPKDADGFDIWIAVTGDSTRLFSGLAMSLQLPVGVELNGPIVWVPRSGLKEAGELLGEGTTVNFSHDCAQQKGNLPVVLARLPLKIQPGINDVMLTPAPHLRFGLSVELCDDSRGWPKPYADAVPVRVRRSLSLWDRITGWFR